MSDPTAATIQTTYANNQILLINSHQIYNQKKKLSKNGGEGGEISTDGGDQQVEVHLPWN